MIINIVGDITGFAETVKQLHSAMPPGEFWALGDLIDRGPDSKGVLDFFIDNKFKSVMGNHEHMMLFEKIRLTPEVDSKLYAPGCWECNGGDQTIKSFGIEPWMEFNPQDFIQYFNYIEQMPLRHEQSGLILTHAPISNKYSKEIYNLEEINKNFYLLDVSSLWNRSLPKKQEGKFQVYGHNSTKGILWHTDKHPQGIYMSDPYEVPADAWAVCVDTWREGFLTGLSVDLDLLSNPQKAITITLQEVVDPFDFNPSEPVKGVFE